MTYSQDLQTDKFETNIGDLSIHFVKHGSLFFEFAGKIIHIDPVARMGDYENYPDADLILITHHAIFIASYFFLSHAYPFEANICLYCKNLKHIFLW